MCGIQGRRYRRSRNTHARRTRRRSSNIKSRVTSGVTSLTVFTRPREIAIREIIRPRLWVDKKSSPPSQTSLLNINGLCSAYVGRNDGYKGPSLRHLITATSPRFLHCDISATASVRTTSTGTTSHLPIYIYVWAYIYTWYRLVYNIYTRHICFSCMPAWCYSCKGRVGACQYCSAMSAIRANSSSFGHT